MNDPTKEPMIKQDICLKQVRWSNKSGILEAIFTDGKLCFTMNEDDPMFEDLFPEGEYKYHDDDGLTVIMVDEYYNMHWLVKDSQGLVHHKCVFVKHKLENIGERKFNDWQ